MKNKKKVRIPVLEKVPSYSAVAQLKFPRPVCLEQCTMDIQKGYEVYIIKTIKAFSNETLYYQKFPHKLEGGDTWSIDVKSRNDKYRMLYRVEGNLCKIVNLCTTDTH